MKRDTDWLVFDAFRGSESGVAVVEGVALLLALLL
jgi:hypothetical protein